MFLMKGIQDKCIAADSEDEDEDVAFVIFNVKGKDLLAIDEPNEFDSEVEKQETLALYSDLEMSTTPFQNVHYYYPYSDNRAWNTYLEPDAVEYNISHGRAHMYKYEYRQDKDNLDLMFASIDDPAQTMDSILSYIISNRGEFGRLTDWQEFLNEVHNCDTAGTNAATRKSLYKVGGSLNVLSKNQFIETICSATSMMIVMMLGLVMRSVGSRKMRFMLLILLS